MTDRSDSPDLRDRVADDVPAPLEAEVPADLRDTWNTPAKVWNREATAADPFAGVEEESSPDFYEEDPERGGL